MKINFLFIGLLLLFFLQATAFAQDQDISTNKGVKDDIVTGDSIKQNITTPIPVKGNIITNKEVKTDITTNKDAEKQDITTKNSTVNEVTNMVKDIVIGKTAEGSVIYLDSKGERYILGVNGEKVYIKKEAK